ncbi:MAG: hypothetical protein H6622_12570 [Halobacteriovoraceae bacterium]|nr:hypothetical protein [Halobacteriovoraceae bacterium]
MRALIEIFLAIIFTVISGTTVLNISTRVIKKETIIKVHMGLPTLESFTKRMTKK